MATEEAVDVSSMKQEALNQLAQGKRHLMVKDYSEAVTSLALACEYLAKVYGDAANECGEAYFNYGKALLELARTENGVLGMEEKPTSEKDDSDEEGDDGEKEDAEASPSSSKVQDNGKVEENGKENGEAGVSGNNEAEAGVSGNNGAEAGGGDACAAMESASNGVDAANGVDEADGEEEEDEEDIPNLNLAWEILELAKIIFQRQADGNKEMELKLAEVNLKLGEVSLESENYLDATKDMKECLNLQIKNLEPDNRQIAETYYQIGIAYSLANQFDDSIEAFANCGKLLELRISNLEKKIKEGVQPDGKNPFYSFQGEIDELRQLFPAIKEKIFDMQDFKNETMKAMMNHKKEDGSDPGAGSSKDPTPSSSVSSSSDAKPVSNISHLVRKKRKSESEGAEAAQPKRVCSDKEEPNSSSNNADKEP